jgi:nitroreductase
MPNSPTVLDRVDEIHPLLAQRWSTRAFDREFVIDDQVMARLLEAVRWTASASNSQPWRLVVARRGSEAHAKLAATLMDFNRVWAPDASALVLFASYTPAEPPHAKRWTQFDTGQAAASLTVQALHEGLVVHQMGGFNPADLASVFALPEGVTPISVMAIGRASNADHLPVALIERESAPRTRMAREQFVLIDE